MATQSLSVTASYSGTGTAYTGKATATATLEHTFSTTSTDTAVTVKGSVVLSAACGLWADKATAAIASVKITVNGTVVKNITSSTSVSSTSILGTDKTVCSYSTTISRTHAAQSPKVVMTYGVLKATVKVDSTTKTNSGTAGSKSTTLSVPARPSYTVKYAANGGSSTPASQTKWYGESLTLQAAISRTGYTFYRWKATNGTLYTAKGSYTANAATTMTAQWTANTYYVKYNANGGSGTMSNSTHTYDTAKTLNYNAFIRTGYTFTGWATSATGGKVYNDGQSVKNLTATSGGTVNLYAVWTANTYTVEFDANAELATGSTASMSMTYDVQSNLTTNGFERTGYTFAGWNTASDGSGTSYANRAVVKNLAASGTATLYAQWSLVITPFSVTSLVSKRVDSNGDDDDTGQYAKITFDISLGNYYDESVLDYVDLDTDSISIVITDSNDQTVASTTSPTRSSNTVTALLGSDDILESEAYSVTVTLSNSTTLSEAITTSATDTISKAYFVIDVNEDGTAIGFGRATKGNEVGFISAMDGTFESDLTIGSDLYLDLPDYQTSGSTDYEIYEAIIKLGWASSTDDPIPV